MTDLVHDTNIADWTYSANWTKSGWQHFHRWWL